MPKPIFNNRINYQNANGRIIQHDNYLNQNVRSDSSPTFANLRITGNTTLEGNLYVEGNTSVLDTLVTEFKDNILLLNDSETGSGVTLNQSGIEIKRGLLENYRIVYDESSTFLKAGVISNLLPVALRENTPLSKGVMVWDQTTNVIKSQNHIDIDIVYNSTSNSTNTNTGSISLNGGLGVTKDTFIGGKVYLIGSNLPNYSTIYTDNSNNSLVLNSVQDIYLTPSNLTVRLPYNKSISFGSNTQSISSNDLNVLTLKSNSDINLTPSTGRSINVPNQIPITFSTINEKVYTDSSNNMVIAGSQDVNLLPGNGNGNGKKVFIPVDTLLSFGTNNQNISANISNDLTVNANNNIVLNPGNNLDIKIPTDATVKFGGSGNQRITANSNNELFIKSSNTLHLMSTNDVNIPSNIPITFNSTLQSISGDTNGNINLNTSNILNINSVVKIINTTNSTTATYGSLIVSGGMGIKKDINCEGSIIVKSTNTDSLNISNIMKVDSSNNGKVVILAGDSLNNSLEINSTNNDASKLISLKCVYSTGGNYTIGRGNSSLNMGRILTVNLPSYSDYSNTGNRSKFSITCNNSNTELFSVQSDSGNIYSLGTFGVSSTQDAINATTASLIVYGGLGIAKSIYTNGKYTGVVSSTRAFQMRDATDNIIFNVDTITDSVTMNGNVHLNTQDNSAFNVSNKFNINTVNNRLNTNLVVSIESTDDSSDVNSGCLNISGGLGVVKSLNVGGNANFNNGINMMNTKISNLYNPTFAQDAATKAYVDLVKQGLYVKDSVNVATITAGNLLVSFASGNVIDNYTLVLDDRILIKNQIDGTENGIYTVTTGAPSRSLDLQTGKHASGIFVFIKAGTINSTLGFICNNQVSNDTVGGIPLNFTEFTGLGNVTPGIALSKIFNELNVNIDNVSIETDNLNNLRIKNTIASTGLTGGSGSPLQTTTDQSHVTKLGTINSGTWRASTVGLLYGGTGQTYFTSGNILFGNGISALSTYSTLFWDNSNKRLGLGTNIPSSNLHVFNTSGTNVLIESTTSTPQIELKSSTVNSFIAVTKSVDDFAVGALVDSLIITNNNGSVQIGTENVVRMSVMTSGNVGINTTNVNYNLDINGSVHSNGVVYFDNGVSSTNSSSGTLLVKGGLSIDCTSNSVNYSNGGGLTVSGGGAFGKDLYIGGNIMGNNTNFNKMTIISTENSTSDTNGALIISGGVSIKTTTSATSVSSGGALTIDGGVSIKKNAYIKNTLNALSDTFLNNLYFTSNSLANYIQSPDISRTTNSFLPINFGLYNNQYLNIFSLTNNGAVLNNNSSLQIGGSATTVDGYSINYVSPNLNIVPNNTFGNINIGTGINSNVSDIKIYGNTGQVSWESTTSNLHLSNSGIIISNTNSNFYISTNTSSTLIINSSIDSTLNIGRGVGKLTTILSNSDGTSNIKFTPNFTTSSLILTNVETTFNDVVNVSNTVNFSGNAKHQTLTNNTNNREWYYIGLINNNSNGYCEIDFNNGVTSSTNCSGLKLIANVNQNVINVSHNHYGGLFFDSVLKPVVYVYSSSGSYYLFVRLATYSVTNVNITAKMDVAFTLNSEGMSAVPNGNVSNYSGYWTKVYSTDVESTLRYTFGDVNIESKLNVNDNLPIIGYNNNNTVSSRDIGTLYQRYQVSNDNGLGDIVSDSVSFIDSIPNQSGATLSQIKLSNLSNSVDDYYIGWWIKVFSGTNINQVRKVVAYNGSTHTIALNMPFTTQNPSSGDTIYFYNNGYIVNYYNESSDSFVLGYTNNKTTNVSLNDYASLAVKHLLCSDTTPSINSTTGSIVTLGGITINSTIDSVSSSSGGGLSCMGGVSVNKNLMVGNNMGIGSSVFTPQGSVHVKKSNATVLLECDTNNNNYNYIDFAQNSNNNRFGIFTQNSIFSVTYNTSGNNPYNSSSAISVCTSGNVGINTTTNINSPLAINASNFISTNSSSGFLGIIGGNTNTNSPNVASRVILNSNNNNGSLNLYSGNVTTANVSIFTRNDVESLRVNSNGTINMYSTCISSNSSTGALVMNGGVSIECSDNATSFSYGGALTVAGGASISKNMYLGGNLYIAGSVVAAGSVSSPAITFSNAVNLSVVEYYNNNLITISSSGIFSFALSVTPTVGSSRCEVQFTLPGRSNNFAKRGELIVSCSGYTDDTAVIPLFNVISVGVIGAPRGLITFESVSTNIHYLQINCTYIIA